MQLASYQHLLTCELIQRVTNIVSIDTQKSKDKPLKGYIDLVAESSFVYLRMA